MDKNHLEDVVYPSKNYTCTFSGTTQKIMGFPLWELRPLQRQERKDFKPGWPTHLTRGYSGQLEFSRQWSFFKLKSHNYGGQNALLILRHFFWTIFDFPTLLLRNSPVSDTFIGFRYVIISSIIAGAWMGSPFNVSDCISSQMRHCYGFQDQNLRYRRFNERWTGLSCCNSTVDLLGCISEENFFWSQ
jgi:hypothetical protein